MRFCCIYWTEESHSITHIWQNVHRKYISFYIILGTRPPALEAPNQSGIDSLTVWHVSRDLKSSSNHSIPKRRRVWCLKGQGTADQNVKDHAQTLKIKVRDPVSEVCLIHSRCRWKAFVNASPISSRSEWGQGTTSSCTFPYGLLMGRMSWGQTMKWQKTPFEEVTLTQV